MEHEVQPQELIEIFAANVRRRRNELGMSQATLAELLDKYIPYVSDIENGKRAVRMSTLTEFAEVLKTTPDSLLKESGKKPRRKTAKVS